MKVHRFVIVLAAASLVLVGTGCGSASDKADPTSTSSTSTTSTTIDLSTLDLDQDVSALPSSEIVIAPSLVSDVVGQDTPRSADQLTPDDVAAQEKLLDELGANRNTQGIAVSIPEVVLFDFGKADLRPGSADTLNKVAKLMGYYLKMQISVQGHTDSVGSNSSNQKLSENRATAVKEALIANGVETTRLQAVGFGETRPVAPNDSDDNRQKNRRVEVVVLNAG